MGLSRTLANVLENRMKIHVDAKHEVFIVKTLEITASKFWGVRDFYFRAR